MRRSQSALLSIISCLYDSVLDPSLWPAAAELTMKYLGVRALLFSGFIAPYDRVFERLEGLAPEHRRLFLERYSSPEHNPVARAAISRPTGQFMTEDSLVPRPLLVRTPFYRELVIPAEVHQFLGVNLFHNGREMGAISVFRSERERRFDDRDQQRMRPLLGHFERAAQLTLKLRALEQDRSIDQDLLDRLPFGVVLVDEKGLAGVLNAAALEILLRGDGLQLRRRKLCAVHPDAQARLTQLLEEARRAGVHDGTDSGGALTIPRPSGEAPYEVLVSPLGAAGQPNGVPAGVALVMIRDRAAQPEPDPLLLQKLYGLTPAEAVVARAVAVGGDPGQVADALKLSVNTVRTHLYRSLQKMGVRRQADLARLLASGPLGLRRPGPPQ